jgi:CDGSH-type Zn-finger protein
LLSTDYKITTDFSSQDNGVEYRDQDDRRPMVTVSRDGPFVVTGDVDHIANNIQFAEGSSREHYTLCRCGASENKSFCDSIHRTINFRDDKNYFACPIASDFYCLCY